MTNYGKQKKTRPAWTLGLDRVTLPVGSDCTQRISQHERAAGVLEHPPARALDATRCCW